MGKSSSASDRQPAAKSPLCRVARDPRVLRRAHAAVHRFVEQIESEVEDAVNAARARQLAPIKRIEQTVRHLYSRYLLTDQAGGTRKPRGLAIEPDFILAMKALEAAPLAGCLSAIHDAIAGLEQYEGVPFARKPIMLRHAGGKAESIATGPEETALAALERVGHDLIGLFHGLTERLAENSTARAARQKKPKSAASGPLTPPKVAKRLGVSADKVRSWIAKGELNATNVAAEKGWPTTISDQRNRSGRLSEKAAAVEAVAETAAAEEGPPRDRVLHVKAARTPMIFSGGGRICLRHQRRPGGKDRSGHDRVLLVERQACSSRGGTT